MASGILYLDVDDEITSAAARVRDVPSGRVALVLPYGSRVATSRINFRLLARDAMTHEKRLSVIASDAATRALAASAGLPVFASVGEYEASLGPSETPAAARSGADTEVGGGTGGPIQRGRGPPREACRRRRCAAGPQEPQRRPSAPASRPPGSRHPRWRSRPPFDSPRSRQRARPRR